MQSLAAIGDGLIGPLVRIGRGDAGLERTFVDNRFINWLRIIAPAVEMEDSVFGTPGATSVAVTKQIEDVLELDPAPRAVLVCAGMEDCLAAIKGVAPSPDQTVRALETIATRSLAAGIRPIFIIPPPCTMFSNGLFADRFVAIAATLRRMHRHDPRIGLIDPTDVLMQKRAYGIEPDPAFVAGGSDGRLSSLGAFRLAQLVASYLQDELAVSVFRPVFDREASGTLNANPQLKGSSGVLATKAVTGRCAKAYRIDARQTGGALIQASVLRRRYAGAQRVTLSGRYTTNWGFVQINQEIDRAEVERLEPGDVIEAFSDFELAGPVSNIAAVSLHATAVWTNDFVGLHSSRYVGGMGVPFSHKGRLRTPQFTLPTKLSKLHVSCQLHLVPGTDLKVGGWLDLRSLVLRKLGPAAAEHHDSRRDERAAAPEVRSAV